MTNDKINPNDGLGDQCRGSNLWHCSALSWIGIAPLPRGIRELSPSVQGCEAFGLRQSSAALASNDPVRRRVHAGRTIPGASKAAEDCRSPKASQNSVAAAPLQVRRVSAPN